MSGDETLAIVGDKSEQTQLELSDGCMVTGLLTNMVDTRTPLLMLTLDTYLPTNLDLPAQLYEGSMNIQS